MLIKEKTKNLCVCVCVCVCVVGGTLGNVLNLKYASKLSFAQIILAGETLNGLK